MDAGFRADELLQQLVPKHRVKFLLVRNEQVRAAIKQRGECWRISPLPKTPDEMKRMIADSKIAIRGRELYYYSKATGTRFLTYEAFCATWRAGRSRPCGNIWRKSASSRPASTATAAGSRLLHGRQGILEGRFRPLRFRRDGRARRCEPPTKRCGRSSAAAVPAEFRHDDLDQPGMAEPRCTPP